MSPVIPQSSGASDVDATALLLFDISKELHDRGTRHTGASKMAWSQLASRPDPGGSAAGKITGVTLSPCQKDQVRSRDHRRPISKLR